MISVCDDSLGRREFLRIGGCGLGSGVLGSGVLGSGVLGSGVLGSWALSESLAWQRALALSGPAISRGKSVVFLFLHGGPPQAEMFDPKMDAPSGIRSQTGEIATTLPGVTYGGTLGKLSRLAHRISVVRSFTTGDGNHDIKPIVGRATSGANIGSVTSRIAGATDEASGLPRNVALFPRAVDPAAQAANLNFGKFTATGPFGSGFSPFVPGGGGDLQGDMKLSISKNRLDDRRHLLSRLDRLRRDIDTTGSVSGVDRLQEQAFSTLLGGAARAFDLSEEDPRTIARYDTSHLIPTEKISKRWNNHKNYRDNVQSLGKLMLLARRLCEFGCGFVTVTTNFVWDMHADQNNATIEEGMRYCGQPFDHAVSAFLEDVEQRGLSDKILLVACGEMGRNPKVNKRGGRDHWGRLAPLLLAGGGLQHGQVIGRSTSDAGEPATEPVTIDHLVGTILNTQFDMEALRVARGLPVEIERLVASVPTIPGL